MLTQQRKPRKTNPLDALLREKAREERTGTGMAAIRHAEEAYAASQAKECLKAEMVDEESSGSDVEWDAVTKTKKGRHAKASARGRTQKFSGSDDEEELAGIDCEAILGSKGGKAVGQILQRDLKDKKARALARLHEEPLGVSLWSATPELTGSSGGMDVDSSLPPLSLEVEGNAVLQLLSNATHSNGTCSTRSSIVPFLNRYHSFQISPRYLHCWLLDVSPVCNRSSCRCLWPGCLMSVRVLR